MPVPTSPSTMSGRVKCVAEPLSDRFASRQQCRIPVLHRRWRLSPSRILAVGWLARVQDENWEAPLYWLKDDDGSSGENVFTLSGVQPLDPHAPVEHVSFYEAAAYASWAGPGCLQNSNGKPPRPTSPMARSGSGPVSAYDPYPGFRAFAAWPRNTTANSLIGQIVLRVDQVSRLGGMPRPTYRNFFPPQARWQFSGIRLASDL